MKNGKPLFILAGNGPYDNRGCEAIVRGTVEILRHFFDDPRFVAVSNYQSNLQFEQQRLNETDEAIIHKKTIRSLKRFEPVWFLETPLRFLYPKGKRYLIYQKVSSYLKEATAVLSVGGDNYSLDYGIPTLFTDLDDFVLAKKKPMVIWGASVGPFGRIPQYEKYMIEHLKKVTAVFVRESATIEYLSRVGVHENVYRAADPAFLLKPVRPPKEKFNMDIPKEAIGINLSLLMARYVDNGRNGSLNGRNGSLNGCNGSLDSSNGSLNGSNGLNKWIEQAAKIIKCVSEYTKRPLFLIYHVTKPRQSSSDYEFLKNVLTAAGKQKGMIELIPPGLNAAELKWVIGKMSAFAGARTHSTIAALSCCVPTLSFAYSLKAKGINRDILGNENYCLEPHQLRPDIVAEKMGELIQNSEEIKKKIKSALPEVENLAISAGKYLKEIVS